MKRTHTSTQEDKEEEEEEEEAEPTAVLLERYAVVQRVYARLVTALREQFERERADAFWVRARARVYDVQEFDFLEPLEEESEEAFYTAYGPFVPPALPPPAAWQPTEEEEEDAPWRRYLEYRVYARMRALAHRDYLARRDAAYAAWVQVPAHRPPLLTDVTRADWDETLYPRFLYPDFPEDYFTKYFERKRAAAVAREKGNL